MKKFAFVVRQQDSDIFLIDLESHILVDDFSTAFEQLREYAYEHFGVEDLREPNGKDAYSLNVQGYLLQIVKTIWAVVE